jgi:hypothetical protein
MGRRRGAALLRLGAWKRTCLRFGCDYYNLDLTDFRCCPNCGDTTNRVKK